LGKNYCVFCFQVYLTFFAPVAFLLIIIIFRGWKRGESAGFALYISVLILLISAGIGFSSYRDFGQALIDFSRTLKRAGLIGRRIPLWDYLDYSADVPYQTAKYLVPGFIGLVAGILLLVLAWSIYRRQRSNRQVDVNFGSLAIGIMLITGLILSPTKVLGNSYQDNDCEGDVIKANETAGQYLAEVIPTGSQIYWQGTDSVIPMLYLPGVSMYLPQIDQDYTYSLGGNSQEMLRIGLWNDELAEGWKQEADFVIIVERRYNSEWEKFFESNQFDELPESPSVALCRDDLHLRIFRRRGTN
jgi:hypothetical protein